VLARRGAGFIESSGLQALGQQEVQVGLAEPSLEPAARALLAVVEQYTRETGKRIHAGETMAFGYWLVKFMGADRAGVLEVWEYNSSATKFVPGAALAMRYWSEQHAVCARAGATFSPPRPDRNAAVSVGVLEGDPVQGVRYPAPAHMSGWYLTTARYDGNASTLKVMHLVHVTAARPDLAQFVALPPGYRFDSGDGSVRFDQAVAQARP
jgi:hypothetical protein